MKVTLTCQECGSGIHVHPSLDIDRVQCTICSREQKIMFHVKHHHSLLESCPSCEGTWFYAQKDFNRKIGVILFVMAAVASFWTYGLSFVGLWLMDCFLYGRLEKIAICYKCQCIFRNVHNIDAIPSFDHERHDRIVYPSIG